MPRPTKRLILLVLALSIAYMAIVLSEWLPRPTAEQEAAMALLREPPQRARGEHDAFPQLWFMEYDVPPDEQPALLAMDIAAQASSRASFTSAAEPRYEHQPIVAEGLCEFGSSCLAHVRDDGDAARAAVERNATTLERALRLRTTDHVTDPMPDTLEKAYPRLGPLGRLQATAHTLQFAAGNHDAALRDACADLAAWRRLHSRSETLIVGMVSLAYGKQHVASIADMLAELPRDHPLPVDCAIALAAPEATEFDMCDAFRTEFKIIEHAASHSIADSAGAAAGLREVATAWLLQHTLNSRITVARLAPAYAGVCHRMPYRPIELHWDDWVFDPVGSSLWHTGPENFTKYYERSDDFRALLQAMRTLVWLREQPDAAAAFAGRPAGFETPLHALTLDADRDGLVVPLLSPAPYEPARYVLPLAGTRSSAH